MITLKRRRYFLFYILLLSITTCIWFLYPNRVERHAGGLDVLDTPHALRKDHEWQWMDHIEHLKTTLGGNGLLKDDDRDYKRETRTMSWHTMNEMDSDLAWVPLTLGLESTDLDRSPLFILSAFYDTRPLLYSQPPVLSVVSAMQIRTLQGDKPEHWWSKPGALSCLVMMTNRQWNADSLLDTEMDNVQIVVKLPAKIKPLHDHHDKEYGAVMLVCNLTLEQHIQHFYSLPVSQHMKVTVVPTDASQDGLNSELRLIPLHFMPNHPLPPMVDWPSLKSFFSIYTKQEWFWQLYPLSLLSTLNGFFSKINNDGKGGIPYPDTAGPQEPAFAVCTAPLRSDLYAPSFKTWASFQRLMANGPVALYIYDHSAGARMRDMANALRDPSLREQTGIHLKWHQWAIPTADDDDENDLINLRQNWLDLLKLRVLRLKRSRNEQYHRVSSEEPWAFTELLDWDIHYYGQVGAIQDCLLRSVGRHQWVAVVDFDEYIVPRSNGTSNWMDVLVKYVTSESSLAREPQVVSALGFRNVFFCSQCAPSSKDFLHSFDCRNGSNSSFCSQHSQSNLFDYGELDAPFADAAVPPYIFTSAVRAKMPHSYGFRSKFIMNPLLIYTAQIHFPGLTVKNAFNMAEGPMCYSLSQEDGDKRRYLTLHSPILIWLRQTFRQHQEMDVVFAPAHTMLFEVMLTLLNGCFKIDSDFWLPSDITSAANYADPSLALLHHYRVPRRLLPVYYPKTTPRSMYRLIERMLVCDQCADQPITYDYYFQNMFGEPLLEIMSIS